LSLKTLNLIDHHASAKINCFAAELDSNNNEIKNENDSLDMQQLVDFMFFSSEIQF
jgi:hypothetical protein